MQPNFKQSSGIPPVTGRTVALGQEGALIPGLGLQTRTFIDAQGYCKTSKKPVVETRAEVKTVQQPEGSPIFAGILLSVTVRTHGRDAIAMGHGAAMDLPGVTSQRSGMIREASFWRHPLSTDPNDTLEAMWKRVLEVISQKAIAEQRKHAPGLPTRLSALLQEQANSFAEVLSAEINARR